MNRSDLVSGIAYLDAIAAAARAKSSALRAMLEADARAEYEEQHTAPTWRIPDVATVTAGVSHEAVVVCNERAFTDWVAARYPAEVQPSVRPSWQTVFLAKAEADGDKAVDPATGEVVPGLTVRSGGEFTGISVRVAATAKTVLADLAGRSLRRALSAESTPAGVRELEAGDQAA